MAELLKIYNDYMCPASDALLDLGTSVYQFKDLYINGKAYIDGLGESILLDSAVSINFRDANTYVKSVNENELSLNGYEKIALRIAGSDELNLLATKLYPETTNVFDLGTVTYQFKDIYSAGIIYATNMTVTGTVTQTGLIKLLSTTVVPFNASGETELYTVPVGKRCILVCAIIVAGADAGTTQIIIGQDLSGSTDDFIPTNTLSNLDAQHDSVILQPIPDTTPLKIKSYAAGTVIISTVSNHAGGASNSLYLYGILY